MALPSLFFQRIHSVLTIFYLKGLLRNTLISKDKITLQMQETENILLL